MSTSKRWTNWAVALDAHTAQAGTPVYVEGISALSLDAGLQTLLEGGDGSVYASFGSLRAGNPGVRFTTSDLKAFLDECGVTGMAIDSGINGDGLEVYFQKMASAGTRDAFNATTHFSVIVGDGLLVPRTLELPHQGVARLSAEAFPISSDGSTNPLVLDETADLPNVNADVDTVWTLGKVDLNGTTVEGVESVSVDFGISVAVEAADSDVYPTFVTIPRIQQRVTLRGVHIDVTSTLTEAGSYFASGVVFYARKRTEGGTYVADATAEHVKFTLGKCRVEWGAISGDPKMIDMTLIPWDTPGSTAPMAISTASAIT